MPKAGVKIETELAKEDEGYHLFTRLTFTPRISIDFTGYQEVAVSTVYDPADSTCETRTLGRTAEFGGSEDFLPKYHRMHGPEKQAIITHTDIIEELVELYRKQQLPAGPGQE